MKATEILKEWIEWAEELPETDTIIWHPPKDLVEKSKQKVVDHGK